MGLLTLAAFGLGAFYLASMARLNDAAPVELKGSISGAYYLAWGIGMSVAAVAVEGISLHLHPSAGFVAFAVLLACRRAWSDCSGAKLDGSAESPLSALRCISKSLRRT